MPPSLWSSQPMMEPSRILEPPSVPFFKMDNGPYYSDMDRSFMESRYFEKKNERNLTINTRRDSGIFLLN
jgi:hypothetical protein